MSKLNSIQKAILELDGGSYQKLMDAYLYKKYKYSNIMPFGSHTATNKTTKGTPDSYILREDEKYIFIMYGTVEVTSYEKIEKDINACLNKDKTGIDVCQISEIICCHTSTNISAGQNSDFMKLCEGIKLTLIGIGTVSHDLLLEYPVLAQDFLKISIDTNQILLDEDFVKKYNGNGLAAPIDLNIYHRETEINDITANLEVNSTVLIYGKSGGGKTRVALEACREYVKRHAKTQFYCIRNNGEVLYNDLKYYFSDDGEYLILVDDANQTAQLEHLLELCINPPDGISVKIIMTVRDYAKEHTLLRVKSKTIPVEYNIELMGDKDITDILENELNIHNSIYLERIIKIAKGNLRLAVLAGKVAINGSFDDIQNPTDIFDQYYNEIIEKAMGKENIKPIVMAALVSFFTSFNIESNTEIRAVLEMSDISTNDFYNISRFLNELEIIDLYQDKAVKISEQSMGNYLLYFAFVKKRYIKLSDVIRLCFPKYKNKITYAVSTIINLFNSDENIKYISSEVQKSWDEFENSNDEKLFQYVSCFYALNEEKTLAFLKARIDKIPDSNFDVSSFDFKKEKNHNRIDCEIVEMLSGFKYSENFSTAVELILYHYEKHPNKPMNFYFCLSDRLGIDRYSHRNQYEIQNNIISTLWITCDSGKNCNQTILLLELINSYLKFEFHCTEGSGGHTITLYTIPLIVCEGLKNFRKNMWSILKILYKEEQYRSRVENIMLNYNTYHSNDANSSVIIEDLENILKIVQESFLKMDFTQCHILKHMNSIAMKKQWDRANEFDGYKNNKVFSIYKTLKGNDHILGYTYEQEQNLKKNIIESLIRSYDRSDFVTLFNVCKEFQNDNSRDEWELQNGMEHMFQILSKNEESYIIAIEEYLKANTPFGNYAINKVIILISFIGIEKTEELINKYEYSQKTMWISAFFSCIPENQITTEYIKKFYEYIKMLSLEKNIIIPNIKDLFKYNAHQSDVIINTTKILLDKFQMKPHVIANYLRPAINCDSTDFEALASVFKDEFILLEEAYLQCVQPNMTLDFEGEFFTFLVLKDSGFLKRYISHIVKFNSYSSDHFALSNLWSIDNTSELVTQAVNELLDSCGVGYWQVGHYMESIFVLPNNLKNVDVIIAKQDFWLKEFINNHKTNEEYLELIFYIVAEILEDRQKALILYFASINKSIDLFKKIPLNACHSSWSGTEVPLIEKRILFLESLLKAFHGVDYIEHKAYLKDRIQDNEQYKQKVLLEEFLGTM